jgi:hypothetical protein
MDRPESGSTSGLLESALSYVRMDYAVIPLPSRKKKPPRIKNWSDSWTKDEDKVRAWWKKWPESNIGIVCGEPSNLVVLDVDGPEGHRALRGHSLPDTVQVTTGRDEGTHYWFHYNPGEDDVDITNKVSMYDQVDLRGEGGYVVAPPSIHPNGPRYKFPPWLDPQTTQPLRVPRWIEELFLETEDEDTTDEILEENLDPEEGNLISPLFKKSAEKYGDLGPLEAPDSNSGQRNRWLYEKCLTHLNLGLSYQSFRAIFYNKVLPRMDRSEGADGERFTNEEINRTIKSAREDAEKCGPLPASVIRFHTYYEKDEEPKEKEYERGPTRWSRFGLKHAVLAFFCRFQQCEYRSGENTEHCYSQLIGELNEWVKESWHNKADVPRTSLCRVLRDLEETGQIGRNSRRKGTGHAVLVIELTAKNPPSVPSLRSNSEKRVFKGSTAKKVKNRARNVREPSRHPQRDPPVSQKSPPNDKNELLECGRTVPEYEDLDQLLANTGLTLRPSERKTCHRIAWVTDDKNFATWVLKQYPSKVIGIVLQNLQKHYEDIENVGGWMRNRLKTVKGKFND